MNYHITIITILSLLVCHEISGDSPQCSGLQNNERFDCYPESGASQDKCQARGCCWQPAVRTIAGPVNVPYCFYPTDYPSYQIQTMNSTSNGYAITLNRMSTTNLSPYKDLTELKVDVIYETDTRIRFKIYDAKEKRWEPPIPLGTPQKNVKPAYNVMFQNKPFGLRIVRKQDGVSLFDSISTKSPLRFADQYIQISTKLPTFKGYGIGEQRAAFLHDLNNWHVRAYWARDIGPTPDANLYGVHNFFVGMLDNGTSFGIFFLNSNAQEVITQPLPALTYRTIGGVLDFFVFTGPDPQSVVQQYMELIGKPMMPPFWSLGFHLCRYGVHNITELRNINKRNRDIGIPFDTQWSDIDYMNAYFDWTYDPTRYNGLPEFVKEVHSYGMHYVFIVDPGISNQKPGKYPAYDDGIKMGVFVNVSDGSKPLIGKVWPGTVVYPDFSHPNADDWWYKLAKEFFNNMTYDGLWIDMNEPSNFFQGSIDGCTKDNFNNPPYVPSIVDNSLFSKTICPSAKHYLTSHYNYHSLYGYFEAKSTNRALRKIQPGKRPFLLSRSTFAGSGTYTFHWTGDTNADWSNIYYSIPQILNFNLFGIPMTGADVCGFGGDTTEELCTRWMQLGAFYPFMRNHNNLGSKDQDPAVWSKKAQRIMINALLLRYALLPYFYTLFYNASVYGHTVARPLFFEFPHDVNTHSIDKQFLLGKSLLVSPVLTQGATSVKAYFPKALWYDVYNASVIQSKGENVLLDAPIEKINIHARGGSIIVSSTPAQTTAALRNFPYGLAVFLDENKSANGELFWDDGISNSTVEEKKYTFVKFSMSNNVLISSPIVIGYNDTKFYMQAISIIGVSQTPKTVSLNGKNVEFSFSAKLNTLIVSEISQSFLTAMKLVISY